MNSPFCLSPGIDPDAWRVLLAARHIAEYHTYAASRLPGFPVTEWIFSLFAGSPACVIIALTFLVAVGGFLSFYKILGTVGVKDRLLLTLAFAFTPVVIINSFTAMDYMWAISFALFSFFLAAQRRYLLSGVFLAIAVGCRISTALMAVPLCYLIWSSGDDDRTRTKNCLTFLVPAVTLSAACYVPAFATYGISFLAKPIGTSASIIQVARIALIDSLGIIGVLAFGLATIVQFVTRNRPESDGPPIPSQWNRVCLIVVALFGVLFILLPAEAGYLIPLIPFALILARLHFSQVSFRILAVGLVLSSLFLSVDSKDRPWSAPSSPVSVQMVVAGRTLAFDFFNGPLVLDFRRRESQLVYAKSVVAWAEARGDSAMLVAGVWMPSVMYLAKQGVDRATEEQFHIGKVTIVGLVNNDVAASIQSKLTPLFYLPGQNLYNEAVYGTTLEQLGGKELK